MIDLDTSFADAEPPIERLASARINPSAGALISVKPAGRLFYKPVAIMSSAFYRGRRTFFRVARRAEPVYLPPEAACPELESEQSLGERLIEAREERGLTARQVASEIKVPPAYVEMMETGNYGAIPDQLYLLPSFRRYAEFLGLDVAEVTASFMLDFEAEENAVEIPPIPRANSRKPLPWRRIAQASAVVGATASIAAIAVTIAHHAPSPTVVAAQAATLSSPAPAAPVADAASVGQFAHVAAVTPVSALAPVAPLAPLAPLTTVAPEAAVVPVSAKAPAVSAPARPTASIATAKASTATHRRPAIAAHHRHPIRKALHRLLTHRTRTG